MKNIIGLLGAVLVVAMIGFVGLVDAQTTSPDSTTEKFGDWFVRCQSSGAEGEVRKICEMTQELNDTKSGRRVLAIGITAQPDESGTASGGLATIVAPLGLNLSGGLTLEGPEGLSISMPFDTCLPAGCIIRHMLSIDELKSISAGDSLTVTMLSQDSKNLQVRLSTNGFSNAWERLLSLK